MPENMDSSALMKLVLIHPFDPRGTKVGGIETHVIQLIRRHPAQMRVLMVGIDDSGELALGQVHPIVVGGREIDFLPIIHIADSSQRGAATSLAQSVTLHFGMALIRHLGALRRAIGDARASIEIERYEFAPAAWLLGRPFVLISHNEGDPRIDKMDSILSRYWFVNSVAERIAVRLAAHIYGVTPRIRDRIAQRYPPAAKRCEVLSVSVDTQLFRATPFELGAPTLRIVYAGRLDEFKDPPTMFGVIRRLHAALDGQVEFHYCGGADPARFAEFQAIAPFTVRHGALGAEQVAGVIRHAHLGILTSHWEGMPCFLLELLASGRPFGGLRLPQFDLVIREGVNGAMAERAADAAETETRVTNAILGLWDRIRAGAIDPQAIHQSVLPWSVDQQLSRLFAVHGKVARAGAAGPSRARVARQPSS